MPTDTTDLLENITALSHEFGTNDYVCGGGGNSSAKDELTLWVKPSGTTLPALTPEAFVGMSRAKLAELYEVEPPAEAQAREAQVKTYMERAVLPTSSGRASVEAPLHSSLSARYVVHTHPALVNGMTCAKDGAAVCRDLFPEALWLDFIDPGFTLCMRVRQEILDFRQQHGHEPDMIFLKSHGVFVAGDTPEEVRASYALIFDRLKTQYKQAQIPLDLAVGPDPSAEQEDAMCAQIRQALAEREGEVCLSASGSFDYATGPISPDHIVYEKSFPLLGEPTQAALQAYQEKYGTTPWIIVWDNAVFGLGNSERRAALALEMAQDGAKIKQLAQAFGGLEYMTERARLFIENWEVESYRSKQI